MQLLVLFIGIWAQLLRTLAPLSGL